VPSYILNVDATGGDRRCNLRGDRCTDLLAASELWRCSKSVGIFGRHTVRSDLLTSFHGSLGTFVSEPHYRVYATFENQDNEWASRFNLPFKVTKAGEEIVIDGVSLGLPKNKFSARNGWVTKIGTTILAGVDLIRSVEFSSFSLEKELEALNESIKIFVERKT
jgi:hypothetical protein